MKKAWKEKIGRNIYNFKIFCIYVFGIGFIAAIFVIVVSFLIALIPEFNIKQSLVHALKAGLYTLGGVVSLSIFPFILLIIVLPFYLLYLPILLFRKKTKELNHSKTKKG